MAPSQPSIAPSPTLQVRTLRLSARQERLLAVPPGAELRCLSGSILLRGAADDGGLPQQPLSGMQAWRAPQGTWVTVSALTPTVLEVREVQVQPLSAAQASAAPALPTQAQRQAQKSRQGLQDLWRRWLLAAWRIRRGRRAA